MRTARTGPATWDATLRKLGFQRSRLSAAYCRDGMLFRTEGHWSVLQAACPDTSADGLLGQLGRPGLWKLVASGSAAPRCVFDLPLAALAESDGPDDESESASPLEACLAWALATARGTVPAGWAPPPRAEVEGWLPPGALTVQAGPCVRQGSLVHGPGRLALTFPILPRVPGDLPGRRLDWLRELLHDGQGWRMVRVGLSGESGTQAALAEVDLTGAPAAAPECVMRTGLDALRWVVPWLAGPAAFLADGTVASRALEEVCPVAGQPAERKVMA